MRKTRHGRSADIVRLDIHDWYGRLLHRLKSPTTNQEVGVAILDLVKDMYGLTNDIIEEIHRKQWNKQIEEQSKQSKMKEDIEKPIKWNKY